MADLEEKLDKPLPNLEGVATKLANMEEDMKMKELLPTIMETFVKFPGVKYTDDRGVERYRSKFTAVESNKMAEAVFDKLAYHFVLRRYGDMNPTLFEQFKKIKDPHGNSLMESEVLRHAGVTLGDLKRIFLENRDDLNPKVLSGMVDNMLKKHTQELTKSIYSEFSDEHKSYLTEWINKKVGDSKLKGKEYKIKKSDDLQDVFDKYALVASQLYKKDK
jgi:hypothetical protein